MKLEKGTICAVISVAVLASVTPVAAQEAPDVEEGSEEAAPVAEPEPVAEPAVAESAYTAEETSYEESAPAEAPPPAEEGGPATSFSLSLNQDTFFGFYPVAAGAVALAPTTSLTFYAIQWTTDLLSTGSPVALGPWTEFGVGVNFDLIDGALSLNPQLGILNGSLLSGSSRPLAFEGVVPNLTMNYADGTLEGELYFGYYIGVRGDDAQNDFVHYWLNAGLSATEWLSFGAHWEHLIHSRGAAEDADTDLYQWLGGYLQFSSTNASLRFTAGVDLVGEDLGDFYKVSVGTNF